ncbi:MAG TPA: ABC transporter ATP-binding protein, partial [Candidatus Binatia bacterium]|nr:ABC transporter ATP-binding protein [Candidatus Binatia bacterium]
MPPLVIRSIIDHHLTVGHSAGLPTLALLYLSGIAGVQAITFLYGYLAAAVAQGVLSDLRTRLFAHLQRLPARYFDRVPIGDAISRCTADVETLDTVFSSGVAVLLANVVRLVTIAVAMVALSPGLSLIAAVVAAPLVLGTRGVQVRVRQAERQSRRAIGAVNTRLQEHLRGIEVIRAFCREPEFIAGFRQVLSRGLAASNRSSFYSALYTPMTAMLSASAVAALLAAGTRPALVGPDISLGTLTAFLLLLQRFFQPITALGEEWQA